MFSLDFFTLPSNRFHADNVANHWMNDGNEDDNDVISNDKMNVKRIKIALKIREMIIENANWAEHLNVMPLSTTDAPSLE